MIRTDVDGSTIKFMKYYALGMFIIFGGMFAIFLMIWLLMQMISGGG